MGPLWGVDVVDCAQDRPQWHPMRSHVWHIMQQQQQQQPLRDSIDRPEPNPCIVPEVAHSILSVVSHLEKCLPITNPPSPASLAASPTPTQRPSSPRVACFGGGGRCSQHHALHIHSRWTVRALPVLFPLCRSLTSSRKLQIPHNPSSHATSSHNYLLNALVLRACQLSSLPPAAQQQVYVVTTPCSLTHAPPTLLLLLLLVSPPLACWSQTDTPIGAGSIGP
jgi:hypothetical protein